MRARGAQADTLALVCAGLGLSEAQVLHVSRNRMDARARLPASEEAGTAQTLSTARLQASVQSRNHPRFPMISENQKSASTMPTLFSAVAAGIGLRMEGHGANTAAISC